MIWRILLALVRAKARKIPSDRIILRDLNAHFHWMYHHPDGNSFDICSKVLIDPSQKKRLEKGRPLKIYHIGSNIVWHKVVAFALLLLVVSCQPKEPQSLGAITQHDACDARAEYLLDHGGQVVTINPTNNPAAIPWNGPTKWFYFLPGDYSSWGQVVIKKAQNIRLDGQDQAVFKNFRLEECQGVIIRRMVFHSGPTSQIVGGAGNIIDDCQFINIQKTAIRIHNSNYNTVQNCTFDGKQNVAGDVGGVQIGANTGKVSLYNKILHSTFLNLTDCFGASYEEKGNNGMVGGTLFAHNFCGVDSTIYTADGRSCSEDGLDIKNGHWLIQNVVENNLFQGFRPTDQSCGGTGSAGYGIVIHRMANNWEIRNNIFQDLSGGIRIMGTNPKHKEEKVRNIRIKENLFQNMRATVTAEPGVSNYSIIISQDSVALCGNLFFATPVFLKDEKLRVLDCE